MGEKIIRDIFVISILLIIGKLVIFGLLETGNLPDKLFVLLAIGFTGTAIFTLAKMNPRDYRVVFYCIIIFISFAYNIDYSVRLSDALLINTLSLVFSSVIYHTITYNNPLEIYLDNILTSSKKELMSRFEKIGFINLNGKKPASFFKTDQYMDLGESFYAGMKLQIERKANTDQGCAYIAFNAPVVLVFFIDNEGFVFIIKAKYIDKNTQKLLIKTLQNIANS